MDSTDFAVSDARHAASGDPGVNAPSSTPPCGGDQPGWSRRGFLGLGTKLVVGATAVFGGLVQFRPTPAYAYTCFTAPSTIDCNYCNVTGCIGLCVFSGNYSCCTYYETEEYYDETCCFCPPVSCDSPPYRTVADCGGSYCYSCCIYC